MGNNKENKTNWGCLVSSIAFIALFGYWIYRVFFFSYTEAIDKAISKNNFEKAHELLVEMSEDAGETAHIIFSDKPSKYEVAADKLLRPEVVYLIINGEFLRIENVAAQYPDGLKKLPEIIQSQKSNIYRQLKKLDNMTIKSLCDYLDPSELMGKYLEETNDQEQILSLLGSLSVKQSKVRVGRIKNKEAYELNQEFIKSVNKYNETCDIVLDYAINTNNKKLANKILLFYKPTLKITLVSDNTFSDDEYLFEYSQVPKNLAKDKLQRAISSGFHNLIKHRVWYGLRL